MRQKKIPRIAQDEPKIPPDKIQADHELFLQAFEKPTQIYRYLQTRHKFMPLFLQRTVSYMSKPHTRHKRKCFKIDSLLAIVEAKQKKEALKKQGYKSEFMNLKFLGFYNTGPDKIESTKLETFITRVSHKKRKNVSSALRELSVGSVTVPCHDSVQQQSPSISPRQQSTPPHSGAFSPNGPQSISLGCDHFRQHVMNSGPSALRSFALLFRATVTLRRCIQSAHCDTTSVTSNSSTPIVNGNVLINGNSNSRVTRRSPQAAFIPPVSENTSAPMCNGVDNHDDSSSTTSMKRRSTRSSSDVDLDTVGLSTPKRRRHGSLATSNLTVTPSQSSTQYGETEQHVYSAELTVYDRMQRCLLLDGDYDVVMHEQLAQVKQEPGVSPNHSTHTRSSSKNLTWETGLDGKTISAFEIFNQCPSMKFKLSWNKRPLEGSVQSPPPKSQENGYTHNNNDKLVSSDINCNSRRNINHNDIDSGIQVYYQFIHNHKARQQTEARDDMRCPWCAVMCKQLYCLLKHLRSCHSRFVFTYAEHPRGARIDVSVSDTYDGSYVGNPHGLSAQLGFAFSRNGPVRRTPVTNVIVFRPKKPSFDLSEFTEPEIESHASRRLVQGHNRLYYHTGTAQPIRPEEIDIDSENENDPEWLRQKTIQLIDDFTDVNEGEKDVMKMWNLHVMKNNYIADCQIPQACDGFVDTYGHILIKKQLARNFILHLANLHDVGLLRNTEIHQIIKRLDNMRVELGNTLDSNVMDLDINIDLEEVEIDYNMEGPGRCQWANLGGAIKIENDSDDVEMC